MKIAKFLYLGLAASFMLGPSWAAKVGDQAPLCSPESSSSPQKIDPAQYQGKVVYLDFWASWCPPCKISFPALNQLHQELHPQGFEIVAVNLDENYQEANAFLQQQPVDFTIIFDPKGKCAVTYEVQAMPTSYLIGKNGIIRHIHHGFRQGDIVAIREQVKALLGE